jgi:hypothetical protein
MAQVMMRTGGFSRPCSIGEMVATRLSRIAEGRALSWDGCARRPPVRRGILSHSPLKGWKGGVERAPQRREQRDSLAERRPHATASSVAV